MGYYNTPRQNDQKNPWKRYMASSFGGVLAGALLVGTLVTGTDLGETESATAGVQTSELQNESAIVTTDVTETVEQTADAVVGVSNLQAGNNPFAQTSTQEAGAGSGVIYKKQGDDAYVVTNHHVVEGAKEVVVTLADGEELEAEVLGSDVWTDLAVLKVPGAQIDTIAEFGDSSVLKSGEPVIAIGNPLGLQFSGSVTTGVISGTERAVPIDINKDGQEDWQSEVLQTDAAINPGNSGGALLNAQGQVIGINSMKIAQDAVEGIGLAIPINSAIPIISELEGEGEVSRPSLGVALLELEQIPAEIRNAELNLPAEVEDGIVVQSVQEGSGADEAGIEAKDTIVELNGQAVTSVLELRQYLYTEVKEEGAVTVKAYRNGELKTFEVQLSEQI
ncbi:MULTISPECIES: S1C family serine protease [unclassified Planococcus (in: firmicutes)]|uniref:S1C family serine protease n=1 Tax=unclassified Planococcus (in: firmicutes) TaxID=2662419 RepID=UPI000C3400DE|nr:MULTISPECIES: S1C family serine protease [unclassified Planococcus (in: firmicutes)]AUD14781.1 2-alkenal reductase [Planococcus sp. MB-3u-03]PKG45096.1 2-alkenal reductase [Planococcus sp. Urea-trap-24]PKG87439.1 2-alkenal reductase [Planococcus sp. Urea-3u-39]PKH42564.1 2-alkenal reductase [Planococcus sp. MB-3u-09]